MRMPNTGRGLPPKIRPDTVLAYFLDDSGGSTGRNRAGDFCHLATFGANPTPSAVRGRLRRAKTFTGTQIIRVAATQRVIDAALATQWTASLALRVDADSVGDVYSFAIGGPAGDAGGNPANFLLAIGFNAREPFLYWESGVTTDRFGRFSGYDMPLGQWTMLHLRRISSTSVEAFVNAELFATLNMVAANTGGLVGTTGVTLGAVADAAGTGVSQPMTGRVSCAYLHAGLLTDEEIAEDFRRFAGLGRPSSVHTRVKVENGLGVLVDLTDSAVMGGDFVEEVRIRENIDDPCATIDLTVARELSNLSAAPLRTDSKINLTDVLDPTSYDPHLYGYREIVAECARVPLFMRPTSTDWFERFRGRADVVDDGSGESVSVKGRDQGGYLVDRQIDEPRTYPQTFGGGGCGASAQSRELVMAEILADNGALATLYTPQPSSSCVVVPDPPDLPRGPLLPALRGYAGNIGWDCKFKWDPVTDAFRLTFFDPGRDKTVPDALVTADDVEGVDGGEQSLADVRTRVTVTSNDSATLNTEGQPMPASYTAIDAVSEAAFDPRLMEIVEDATRGIDTSAERQRMADGVLADVSTLRRTGSTSLAAFPELEVYDYVAFAGRALHFTAEQKAGARQVEHVFTPTKGTTRLAASGKPAAGFKRWFDLEAGRAGPLPLRSPDDALRERLGPGMLEGVLEFVDRSAYPGGAKFINLKNGDFARFTRGDAYPPDAWEMAAGTWGSDASAQTSTVLSGGRALAIANTTAQVRSAPVAIVGNLDQPISVEVSWRRVSGDDLVQIDLEWLDLAKATISTVSVYPGGPGFAFVGVDKFTAAVAGTGTWFQHRADGILPPTSARFVRVIVRGRQVGGAFGAIIVDTVSLYRSARRAKTGPAKDAVARPAWINFINPINAGFGIGVQQNIPFLDITSQVSLPDGDVYDVYESLAKGTTAATTSGAFYNVKESGKYRIFARVWFAPSGGVAVGQPLGLEICRNALYSLATGARTGFGTGPTGVAGQVILSNRFARAVAISHPNAFVEGEVEVYLLKGDRITIDFRNDAAAGTVQIATNCGTVNVADATYAAFDMRVTD